MPRGILRNKSEGEQIEHAADLAELDRQEVIRNTRLNAKLTSPKEKSKGDLLREKIAEQKAHEPVDGSDHLKWDELNLYKTEQEKNSTMKIDEPKTPYEGGFNPEGEYYKNDDEDIPGFELGAGEFDEEAAKQKTSLNGGEIIKDPETEQDEIEGGEEEEEPEETAEERHKRFEEMRKQHYHMKGNALKHGIQISDDEDEN